jgi:hypothetical protein
MVTVGSVPGYQLTPTSYVVLGMTALRGPTTSYDLKRAIGRSIGYFWRFPHAQIYDEPARLAEAASAGTTIESRMCPPCSQVHSLPRLSAGADAAGAGQR